MNFELDEQQQMVKDMVRSFSEDRVRPGAAERDRTGEFPDEIFAEMGELGLLGMMVPEAWGGAGMDLMSYLLAVEELARVDASVAGHADDDPRGSAWHRCPGPAPARQRGLALGRDCARRPA